MRHVDALGYVVGVFWREEVRRERYVTCQLDLPHGRILDQADPLCSKDEVRHTWAGRGGQVGAVTGGCQEPPPAEAMHLPVMFAALCTVPLGKQLSPPYVLVQLLLCNHCRNRSGCSAFSSW